MDKAYIIRNSLRITTIIEEQVEEKVEKSRPRSRFMKRIVDGTGKNSCKGRKVIVCDGDKPSGPAKSFNESNDFKVKECTRIKS